MTDAQIIQEAFNKARNKPIEIKQSGYERYCEYYGKLKDACARYPYSIVESNPPNKFAMYFRKMNFNEFCNNDLILSEFAT